MSHLEEKDKLEDRNLGDEWSDWNGKDDDLQAGGQTLFLATSYAVMLCFDFLLCLLVYMISPRLSEWASWLSVAAWTIAILFVLVTFIWLTQITMTVLSSKNFILFKNRIWILLDMIFGGVFRLSRLLGISRDKMGNSFVRAYNEISKAIKERGKKEKLLILLPRCLTKEQIKEINSLKDIYPIFIHTVSGGELARKRIKELRPTAVIGVACERDLVSGIKDVGKGISLIGIPNIRPEGPCKNTLINMKELIDAIEFYVGPPTKNSDLDADEQAPH